MGIKLPDNFSGKELTKETIGLVRGHKTETGEHKTSRVTIEQIDDENLYFLNREFSDFALFYKDPVAENPEETPAEPAGSATPTDPAKQEEENPSVSDEPEAPAEPGKEKPNVNAVITVEDARIVDYGTDVVITATATGVDEGYHLEIVIGDTVCKGDRTSVKAELSKVKADISYTVRVVSDDGTVQEDLIREGGEITCDAGFFKVLLSFLRDFFGFLYSVFC